MRILSKVLGTIGFAMFFVCASSLDSVGSSIIIPVVGTMISLVLLVASFLIGKDAWEYEEII